MDFFFPLSFFPLFFSSCSTYTRPKVTAYAAALNVWEGSTEAATTYLLHNPSVCAGTTNLHLIGKRDNDIFLFPRLSPCSLSPFSPFSPFVSLLLPSASFPFFLLLCFILFYPIVFSSNSPSPSRRHIAHQTDDSGDRRLPWPRAQRSGRVLQDEASARCLCIKLDTHVPTPLCGMSYNDTLLWARYTKPPYQRTGFDMESSYLATLHCRVSAPDYRLLYIRNCFFWGAVPPRDGRLDDYVICAKDVIDYLTR